MHQIGNALNLITFLYNNNTVSVEKCSKASGGSHNNARQQRVTAGRNIVNAILSLFAYM